MTRGDIDIDSEESSPGPATPPKHRPDPKTVLVTSLVLVLISALVLTFLGYTIILILPVVLVIGVFLVVRPGSPVRRGLGAGLIVGASLFCLLFVSAAAFLFTRWELMTR